MKKWQVCKVMTEKVKSRWSWDIVKASAELLTPEGEGSQVMAEIETDTREGWAIYRMIAKLGLEGWEPMPVYTQRSVVQGDPEVSWWFKRQLGQ